MHAPETAIAGADGGLTAAEAELIASTRLEGRAWTASRRIDVGGRCRYRVVGRQVGAAASDELSVEREGSHEIEPLGG